MAQNLIPNGGFETYTSCPDDFSGDVILAVPWTNGNAATPDLFNLCNNSGNGWVGVPSNSIGLQSARSGNGYAGIYNSNSSDIREYVQVLLINSLESGKKYCASFYVSLGDEYKHSMNRIGMYCSATPVYQADQNVFNTPFFIPQVENPATIFLDNKNDWELVSGIIVASGNENYITIGNFYDKINTSFKLETSGSRSGAYYYIDDVSLYLMPGIGNDTIICLGEEVLLGDDNLFPPDSAEFKWTTIAGAFVSNGLKVSVSPVTSTSYVLEASYNACCCVIRDTIEVVVDQNCIRSKNSCKELFIPNAFSPNGDGDNDELKIYGTDCIARLSFSIYDRLGQKVFVTNDVSATWDGNFKGSPMGTQVFIYVLKAEFTNGEIITRQGNISLIR